jgi:hypothetical protein
VLALLRDGGVWKLTILNRYLPDGNFKFGAVEITTPELSEQSMLHYRLFVDGEEVWTHTIPAPPVAGHGLFEAGR